MPLFSLSSRALASRCLIAVIASVTAPMLQAQSGQDVTAAITVNKSHGSLADHSAENVVVWLTSLDGAPPEPHAPVKATLVQRNKQFSPHLLVVPTGTTVDFPNLDPFFHNVFSMFNGKRFDLGLYESGSRRSVRFDREGVSFIFCNIHPEMGAIVVALTTPYYATSDVGGHIVLHNVPAGHYRVNVWSEHFQDDFPAGGKIVIVDNAPVNLGNVQVSLKADPLTHHKNKFGEDYVQPSRPPY
jgi:plastocyanin